MLSIGLHSKPSTPVWTYSCVVYSDQGDQGLRGGRIHPLLRFMIQLDSQAGCDDGMIQFKPFHIICVSKDIRFPIPNYISIEVNNHSVIRSELWQTGADSTQFNSFMWCLRFNVKCRKYTPLHICLISSQPMRLANQLQSSQLFDVAGSWHFKELN